MKILIVDDEFLNRRLLRAILDKIPGYESLEAESGAKALEIAAATSIDLVLLDIMMPDMDGYETCRQLKQLGRFLPVLMISAVSDINAIRMQAMASGADGIFAKPIDRPALLLQITTCERIKKSHDRVVFDLEQLAPFMDDIPEIASAIPGLQAHLAILRTSALQLDDAKLNDFLAIVDLALLNAELLIP